MNEETTPKPPKAKRKKSTTPRAPRVKDDAILAIEREAAEKKAKYRLSQQSGGILKRIEKLKERLSPADRQRLLDSLLATETPALINTRPPSMGGRASIGASEHNAALQDQGQ